MTKCAPGCYMRCDQMSGGLTSANPSSLTAPSEDRRNRPEYVLNHSQDVRGSSIPGAGPYSHQRRWSADFYRSSSAAVITVKKKKMEPKPPQRSVSLPQTNTRSRPAIKRYSCPPTGFCRPHSFLYSSSSSSSLSSTGSRSSPPPVQTSVITGPDPRGWKLQPKSASTSRRAKRLSLQIPLPVIPSDPQACNTIKPDASPQTKPPLGPKPSRRRHSDSSAFLRSLATSMPVVTLDDLCAVRLNPVALTDESDDVFNEGSEQKVRAAPLRQKIPPPVAEKTPMARQKAKLMAHSNQSCRAAEENIYACVIKPKPKDLHQTEDHVSLREKMTGKLDNLKTDRK